MCDYMTMQWNHFVDNLISEHRSELDYNNEINYCKKAEQEEWLEEFSMHNYRKKVEDILEEKLKIKPEVEYKEVCSEDGVIILYCVMVRWQHSCKVYEYSSFDKQLAEQVVFYLAYRDVKFLKRLRKENKKQIAFSFVTEQ